MTKLRIASDFHLEFYQSKTPMSLSGKDMDIHYLLPVMENEQDQVLILAGDICTVTYLKYWDMAFENLSNRFKKIILVIGNHEHYGYNFNRTFNKLRTFISQWDNIVLMENEHIVIDDVAIFGATFWTNFANRDQFSMLAALNGMPDFRIVKYGAADEKNPEMKFTPELSVQQHETSMFHLREFLKKYKGKKVVVTHHAPSFRSSLEMFKGTALNPAFATDLEYLFDPEYVDESEIPQLWIHGHMHNVSDYMINNTRIVANPFGYWSENKEYNSKLVIDI